MLHVDFFGFEAAEPWVEREFTVCRAGFGVFVEAVNDEASSICQYGNPN
jgi:hypothetical protein